VAWTVGILYISAAVAAQLGGGSIDPTDPSNFNQYALTNDSGERLYVHYCDDTACRKLDGNFKWVEVRPAATDTESDGWGMGELAYAVSANPNGGFRCLMVNDKKKHHTTMTIPLSQATGCR
jgi:hypothetical protein